MRTRNFAVLGAFVVVGAGIGMTGVVLAASDEKTHDDGGFFSGLRAKFEEKRKKLLNIEDNKKALPDPAPPPYGKPLTVVLADEILLVQEYQPLSGGMLTKKRPGVEYFLAQLAQDYEVVIWSLQNTYSYGPIIEKLDPNHHAMYRLYVDATVVDGERNVKDLKVINRALEKTIVIDFDKNNVVQQDNVIVAPKYGGELEDVYLLELLNFFKLLATYSKAGQAPDVREWVQGVNKNGLQPFKQALANLKQVYQQRIHEQRKKWEEKKEQQQIRDEAAESSPRSKW